MTAPKTMAAKFDALSTDLAEVCEVIQGVLIHRDMANFLYGIALSDARREEAHLRPTVEMLSQIFAHDSRPLTIARKPDHRRAGVCRHFAIMLTAILREQGVAARARCGFGAYFTRGKFEDHWVCEYWSVPQERWILVDAQLDPLQRSAFHLDFDPLDVPRDRFIIAGEAWQMCREGRAAPDRFGLSHLGLRGSWFIAGNVLRDLAALNRMEMLPWDVWGMMPLPDQEPHQENAALIDRVAALTLAADEAFAEFRNIYESNDRLRVPPTVFNALRSAPELIHTD
jgi:hypothetical protein